VAQKVDGSTPSSHTINYIDGDILVLHRAQYIEITMKIYEEKIQLSKDGKPRTMVKIKCDHCHKKIWKEKRWIRSENCFCNQQCKGLFYRKGREILCSNCGKKNYKKSAWIRASKTKLFFCNNNCRNEAQHVKHIFRKAKIISCYKCGDKIEVDSRASRKICPKCIPETKRTKIIDYKKVLEGKEQCSNFYNLRKYLIKNGIKENKCEICGINEWLGKPLVIQLHHKNGDKNNNKLENLQMACPNCHSQTNTWGTKNKK
jgi:hypothetical protein